MRRLCVLLLAVSAAPAFAAEHTGELVFECGGGEAVATRAAARIEAWTVEARRALDPGAQWDERELGPFGLVRGRMRLELGAVSPVDPRFTLRLSLDDSDLKSGSATFRALGERVTEWYRSKVEGVLAEVRRREHTPAERDRADARERREEAETALRELESAHGNPLDAARANGERLARAGRDLAAARIDRIVAEKELEAARGALKRAGEAAALERQVAEARAEMEKLDPFDGARETHREQIERLEKLLADARVRAPSLDVARERVFDLEVRLVGLETRSELLEEELTVLRAASRELAATARAYTTWQVWLDAATRELDEQDRRVRAIERMLGGEPFVVVRPFFPE